MLSTRKIINDPVYGFITIDHPLILQIIAHPYYQRLRRIHQIALAQLVYPGAVHTRLHHSLGAYHLICNALTELRSKGFDITPDEELGAKIAILLHDIGHGPYSHALESVLLEDVHHEDISLLIMQLLNQELKGQLDTAIAIFTNNHPKKFLHQLISGQIDVDRMDYLARDSFFTGVSEGVIAYDRLLKMFTVHNGELMIEEKGIYSIEKFLVARRLMYWQVYLHKTVLGTEQMLVKIMQRARQVKAQAPSPLLDAFLTQGARRGEIGDRLADFCALDDYDVLSAIKYWTGHPDKILSLLCRWLINRKLLKTRLQAEPFTAETVQRLQEKACLDWELPATDIGYLVFSGEAVNTTYDIEEERIHILFKDGQVKDISQVDNALIHKTLASPVKKFYICYPVK
jgi:hypothetical protein